jgi:hypothetical protein
MPLGVPPERQSGERACAYENWWKIYKVFDDFVASSSCREWSEATTLIIYAIARDSDNMHLIKSMEQKTDDLVCLAERAVTSPELGCQMADCHRTRTTWPGGTTG